MFNPHPAEHAISAHLLDTPPGTEAAGREGGGDTHPFTRRYCPSHPGLSLHKHPAMVGPQGGN